MIDREDYSDAEYEILAQVAERKGWEWVEQHTSHILAQAALFYGDI